MGQDYTASSKESIVDRRPSRGASFTSPVNETRNQHSGSLANNNTNSHNHNHNNGVFENDGAFASVSPNKGSSQQMPPFRRRRSSVPVSFSNTVSDADSQHSDSSNETEEDVWFPMDKQKTRNPNNLGIDFSELQGYIDEQRNENEALLKENQGTYSPASVLQFQNYNLAYGNDNGHYADDNEDSLDPAATPSPVKGGAGDDQAQRYKKHKLSKAAIKYVPKWLQYRTSLGKHGALYRHAKPSKSKQQRKQKKQEQRQQQQQQQQQQQLEEQDSSSLNKLPIVNEKKSSSEDLASSKRQSTSALDLSRQQVGFAEEHNKIEDEDATDVGEQQRYYDQAPNAMQQQVNIEMMNIPYRFSLFTSENSDTIHAHDLTALVKPGQSIEELFKSSNPNFTWWLNCCCATDSEIKILAKTFGIHPLTAEDIRMSENREKVEFFKDYYFVCFHSFNADNESEDFLEPIFFYMLVFKTGFLTFHNSPGNHCVNVRRRIRQLRDYVPLSPDWICYALIDDITDSFFPVIQAIDYETDVVEATVFAVRDMDFSTMLHRIGLSRNKVMNLLRLLGGKADVLRMLSKRCHDYNLPTTNGEGSYITSNFNNVNGGEPGIPINTGLNTTDNSSAALSQMNTHHNSNLTSSSSETNSANPVPINQQQPPLISGTEGSPPQPRNDISLYLGDIQDHIITMHQNLTSYEKILARSYTNYLAQLQVESFNSNNKVTDMLSKVTLIGTVLVPLNVITGLFGMNVRVPGQDGSNLGWFFGIVGVLLLTVTCGICFANWWVSRLNKNISEMNGHDDNNGDSQTLIARFLRRSVNFGNNNNNRNRGTDALSARANTRSMVSYH